MPLQALKLPPARLALPPGKTCRLPSTGLAAMPVRIEGPFEPASHIEAGGVAQGRKCRRRTDAALAGPAQAQNRRILCHARRIEPGRHSVRETRIRRAAGISLPLLRQERPPGGADIRQTHKGLLGLGPHIDKYTLAVLVEEAPGLLHVNIPCITAAHGQPNPLTHARTAARLRRPAETKPLFAHETEDRPSDAGCDTKF